MIFQKYVFIENYKRSILYLCQNILKQKLNRNLITFYEHFSRKQKLYKKFISFVELSNRRPFMTYDS